MVEVLVEELGSLAARRAISCGVSPFAFALEMSDNTAPSLIAIPLAWMMSDLALISSFMSFFLQVRATLKRNKSH
jgi:hypothetical protein